jgi:processive 1,2-diacylglycerol beta-glucosyltransferase
VLPPRNSERRVLYMIHAATRRAPELAQRLAELGVDLTVTIGRADMLRQEIEAATGEKAKVIGWTDELPRMLHESHLLIGKAGGATVQETIAAGCPMIINYVVAGQEEGNARLITETNSGVIANSPRDVIAQVQRAFADGAKQWHEWADNISNLSLTKFLRRRQTFAAVPIPAREPLNPHPPLLPDGLWFQGRRHAQDFPWP